MARRFGMKRIFSLFLVSYLIVLIMPAVLAGYLYQQSMSASREKYLEREQGRLARSAAYFERYNIGTASRMGPGYFPMLLGGFLFFLGFFITAKSVLFKSTEEDGGKFGKFDWYNFFVILGSVTIFAVLLRPAGLIPATAVMVFLSSFGNRPFRWIRTLLLCAFLCVAVWLIFVLGLDLTVPIWPAFLTN